MSTQKTLIIVESPTKAKTIGKFLGDNFDVQSSYGHIRDLPKSELGVDVKNGFAPKYVVPKKSTKQVSVLKAAVKKADRIILATDEDREGEAIAWHVAQTLKLPKDKTERIVFHEITKSAINAALEHARPIDMELVEAQQARRILDRLVGYTLSPFLWKKVGGGLSAGRVQSVVVRLIVDREREVRAFTPEEYWSVDATLRTNESTELSFVAGLRQHLGKKIVPTTTEEAQRVVDDCQDAEWHIRSVEEKTMSKAPPAPFTTSTLQQEASRKLGFSVKQTMTLAQRLYETGLITYMRTDSVSLAKEAVASIRAAIQSQFGPTYLPESPRTYTTKSKGAQEAHEAIRPTNITIAPEAQTHLESGQQRLYDLIWRRTLATQLTNAQLKRVGVNIDVSDYTFRATGQTVVFDGFLRAYTEGHEEHDESPHGEKFLPPLKEGERCHLETILPEQHFTKPPPRYSEASLVKKLEEEGIGRPSTYAPTISTVQSRGYVTKDGRQLIPEDVAFIVTDLLAEHFSNIVDVGFTAKMEEDLDAIAEGKKNDTAFLHGFYDPFAAQVAQKQEELTKADVSQERVIGQDPETGLDVLVRLGRFGPYIQLGRLEDMPELPPKLRKDGTPSKAKPKRQKPKSASVPKGKSPDDVTLEDAFALLAFPRVLGEHEGEEVTANLGRFGPYIKCGDVNGSIPETQDPTTITLEEALELCTAAAEKKKRAAEPLRILGNDPATKKELQVKTGRYGEYVTDGETNASIPKRFEVETITLEEAAELLKKKRERGPGKGRRFTRTTKKPKEG
jgi:DNA topoisomerase I